MLFGEPKYSSEEEISMEASQYIMEGVMLDTLSNDEIAECLEDSSDINTALAENVLMEKTIVRLDKKAKLAKAEKMAIFTIAQEKNDPKFKKLKFLWRTERKLEDELGKKYGNEAKRRAKKAVQNAGKSNSNIVKKAADKAKSVFNKSESKAK